MKYQAFERGGITCRTFDELDPKFKAWLSKPCPPWEFGEFMGAFLSLEDAEQATAALNAAVQAQDGGR